MRGKEKKKKNMRERESEEKTIGDGDCNKQIAAGGHAGGAGGELPRAGDTCPGVGAHKPPGSTRVFSIGEEGKENNNSEPTNDD